MCVVCKKTDIGKCLGKEIISIYKKNMMTIFNDATHFIELL